MDITGNGRLVAAAGKRGIMNIFAVNNEQDSTDKSAPPPIPSTIADILESPHEYASPVCTVAAHTRWASTCQFVPTASSSASTLLISSGDDGTLALWNVDEMISATAAAAEDAQPDLLPVARLSADELHDRGIFCSSVLVSDEPSIPTKRAYCATAMDTGTYSAFSSQSARPVLTAGKDSTVILSAIGTFSLTAKVRVFEGYHTSVVKAVEWRDSNVFGSAGNDRSCCVFDVRARKPLIYRFAECHDQAINSVRLHRTLCLVRLCRSLIQLFCVGIIDRVSCALPTPTLYRVI
jgi:WD40 repeat protein